MTAASGEGGEGSWCAIDVIIAVSSMTTLLCTAAACAGAVALWGLLATLPIGFLVSMIGLVFWIVVTARKPKA